MTVKNDKRTRSFLSKSSVSIFIVLFLSAFISNSFFIAYSHNSSDVGSIGYLDDQTKIINAENSNREINFTISAWENGSVLCEYQFNWTSNGENQGVRIYYPITVQNLSFNEGVNRSGNRNAGYQNYTDLYFDGSESFHYAQISFEWPDCIIFLKAKCYFLGGDYFLLPNDWNETEIYFPVNLEILLPNSTRNLDFYTGEYSGPELSQEYDYPNLILRGIRITQYLSRFSFEIPNIPQNYRMESYVDNHIKLTCHEAYAGHISNSSILASQGYQFLREELGTIPRVLPLEVVFAPKQYIKQQTRVLGNAFFDYLDGKIYMPIEEIVEISNNISYNLRRLYHEMTHAFTPGYCLPLPKFFLEGLAEFSALETLRFVGHVSYAEARNRDQLIAAEYFRETVDNQTRLILEWNWGTLYDLHKRGNSSAIDYAYDYSLYIIQSIYNETDSEVYKRLFRIMSTDSVLFLTSWCPFCSIFDLNIFLRYLEISAGLPLDQLFVEENLYLGTMGFYNQLSFVFLIGLISMVLSIMLLILHVRNYKWRKIPLNKIIIILSISFLLFCSGFILEWIFNLPVLGLYLIIIGLDLRYFLHGFGERKELHINVDEN